MKESGRIHGMAALSTVVASATEAAIAELKRMRNTILLPIRINARMKKQ